jgi:hypothetical protein
MRRSLPGPEGQHEARASLRHGGRAGSRSRCGPSMVKLNRLREGFWPEPHLGAWFRTFSDETDYTFENLQNDFTVQHRIFFPCW